MTKRVKSRMWMVGEDSVVIYERDGSKGLSGIEKIRL